MYHFKVLFFQLAYNNSLQSGTSLVVQRVKRLPTVWETRIRSLGQDDPLEKEMATHSSILAWRIPWMEELCGQQSTDCKESDTTERFHFLFTFHSCKHFLAGPSGKDPPTNAVDPGLISGLGISPGEGNGNPLQYSCLENPMDGGA